MRLAGKTAVVTAAAAGIGRAVAQAYVREGAKVHAVDRDAAGLATIGDVEQHEADLTAPDAAAMLRERTGRADILFNGVGIVHSGTLLDCTDEDWHSAFDLNVTAMFRLIRAYLPAMLDRSQGSIINVSSVASSMIGVRGRFAYGASKAAVVGLTKSVAADFVSSGVRCNAICPGTIESPSLLQRIRDQALKEGRSYDEIYETFAARQPMGRLGRPEEVAALAVYLGADESVFTTGTTSVIDGGWTAE